MRVAGLRRASGLAPLEMARGLVAACSGAGEVGGTGRMVADEHGIFF